VVIRCSSARGTERDRGADPARHEPRPGHPVVADRSPRGGTASRTIERVRARASFTHAVLIGLLAVALRPAPARAEAFALNAGGYLGTATNVPGGTVKGWLDLDTWAVLGDADGGLAFGLGSQVLLREQDANTFTLEAKGGVGAGGNSRGLSGLFATYAQLRYVHDVTGPTGRERSMLGFGIGATAYGFGDRGFFGHVSGTVYRGDGDTTAGIELQIGASFGPLYLATLLRGDGALGLMWGAGLGLAVGGNG
jgi:hypothetical protein